MKYKVYSEIDIDAWKSFLDSHKHSNIFHSFEFTHAISKIKGYRPIVLSQEEKGKILNLAVGYTYTEYSNYILKRLTQRALFLGGILSSNADGLPAFIEKLALLCKNYKNIYSNFYQIDSGIDIKGKNFIRIPALNFIFKLDNGLDVVWDNFKSKKRQNIRKAGKNGLIIEEGQKEDLKNIYECIAFTYRKLKLPFFSYEFLKTIYEELAQKDMIKLFIASHNNNIIATRISLYYGNKAYDWYAGAYNDSNKFKANDVLVWESLKSAYERGCDIFDFGGAGLQGHDYGVRDFKSKFGPILKEVIIYKKTHKKIIYKLIEFGRKIV